MQASHNKADCRIMHYLVYHTIPSIHHEMIHRYHWVTRRTCRTCKPAPRQPKRSASKAALMEAWWAAQPLMGTTSWDFGTKSPMRGPAAPARTASLADVRQPPTSRGQRTDSLNLKPKKRHQKKKRAHLPKMAKLRRAFHWPEPQGELCSQVREPALGASHRRRSQGILDVDLAGECCLRDGGPERDSKTVTRCA